MTSDQPSLSNTEDLMSAAVEETPLVEETIEPEEPEAVMVENPTKPEEKIEQMKPEKSTSEQQIYIGDSVLRNGVALRTDQVFIGGLPTYLNELYEEYPMIKALFVPISSMFEAKKELQTVGTLLYLANRSLKGD